METQSVVAVVVVVAVVAAVVAAAVVVVSFFVEIEEEFLGDTFGHFAVVDFV